MKYQNCQESKGFILVPFDVYGRTQKPMFPLFLINNRFDLNGELTDLRNH